MLRDRGDNKHLVSFYKIHITCSNNVENSVD